MNDIYRYADALRSIRAMMDTVIEEYSKEYGTERPRVLLDLDIIRQDIDGTLKDMYFDDTRQSAD